MYAFSYVRPGSVAEAVACLEADPESKLIAGGQTLLPSLKLRLAAPKQLVDLQNIAELKGINLAAGKATIGAMTRHADVAVHAGLGQHLRALSFMAGEIGDRMVRNMGTIGGSIANSDPAADYPAALLALDATIVTSERRIGAGEFFRGLFETALSATEIVVAVEIPFAHRAAYIKFKHPASRFAMVGVFVAQTSSGPRVAVTGAGSSVFRVPEMESALKKSFVAGSLAGIAVDPESLSSDMHSSAEYRANLVSVLAKRAVTMALQM